MLAPILKFAGAYIALFFFGLFMRVNQLKSKAPKEFGEKEILEIIKVNGVVLILMSVVFIYWLKADIFVTAGSAFGIFIGDFAGAIRYCSIKNKAEKTDK